ncbi:unnamed protein product [marine sediment metagenome]|uniref:Uncharacterized protein n=1 Tax=marine sediment metagenome TaxID=412755 RepID=X1SH67_9ZZZZ
MKFRYRIKVRALGREWVWQWGDSNSVKAVPYFFNDNPKRLPKGI